MKYSRSFLIFSYGLFTIAAQALLFREFITTFEGNDISVGIFFGCWFLWVGVGAIVVYQAKSFAEKLVNNIEFLFLCYIPAFILQLILIIQGRELAGIEYYQLLPVWAIILLSILLNAPVSIITGMLFPTACRWFQEQQQQPISRVYILEAAGSFVGGLGVTILLGFGVRSATIFFILAFIVSFSFLCVQLARAKRWAWVFVPVCILICLVTGVDEYLSQELQIIKWGKLLARDALKGSFQTAQAEYLYGVYQDQWIAVCQGSTCETLPDRESAGMIAAVGLCQNPGAERVLVIGSGLGLCYEFLRLQQIKEVTWAHSDSEYVQSIEKFIPVKFRTDDERLHKLGGDVRLSLAEKKQYYDIVILNLPDATSSVLNRFFTLEFYRQVKKSLRPGGVLQVRIAGGTNIMGTELINLGASTKLTLEKVPFSQLVLTPGEDTWFIVSDSGKLSEDPAVCRDRFTSIEGASSIYPPDGLFSVYLPNRAATALEGYSRADLPKRLLINRDTRPLTHLFSLLLTAKQSGAPVTILVKHLVLAGTLVFVIPIFVLIALRVIYVLKSTGQGSYSSFDSVFLVFSAGWIGIGVIIVLMYLYQTRYGSLYLYIGIISSLFMVGLTVGAVLISALINRALKSETLLFTVVLIHALILAVIIFWPGEQWTHLIFAITFIVCGLCTGCYFPLAARQLTDNGFEAGQAGSKLETSDHLGAAAGGMVTSLALLPVLGAKVTLFIFILLILANMPFVALRVCWPVRGRLLPATAFRLRRVGYILFGIGITIILCSNVLVESAARLRPCLPEYAAGALAGELQIQKESGVLFDGSQKINYFKVSDADDKLTGYIFSTKELAPEVRGYGGEMNIAVYVDTAGNLINFHIISSNETPSYLELLRQWREGLNGRRLFASEPFADIDAVSGATVSCEAIVSALQISGNRFATEILGESVEGKSAQKIGYSKYLPDITGAYLIGAFVVTLIVIYYGGFWSRLFVLVLNLVIGGVWLNAQYSSEQIATLLSLQSPALRLSGAFLLAAGVPVLVIIFGNIYCGYICPFGIVQELLGYIFPDRFRQPVSIEKMQKARFIKYVILFVLVIVFFASRDRTTLAAEPLISIFNFQSASAGWQLSMILIAAAALTGSVFYTRFWCRYLCPVGAYLSLFNNIIILKRYLPAKRFGRCEFGLTAKDHLDCIYCDRCRFQTKEQRPKTKEESSESLLSRYLLVFVILTGIFVSAVSVNRFLEVTGAVIGQPTISAAAGGQPRDVDLQRIRRMIEQKRLSDREAEYYEKVE